MFCRRPKSVCPRSRVKLRGVLHKCGVDICHILGVISSYSSSEVCPCQWS